MTTPMTQQQQTEFLNTYKTDVDNIVSKLNYTIRLPQQFQSNFVQLHADTPTRLFLSESVRKFNRCFAMNWCISTLRTVLGYCFTHTDVIGFLNVGLMHIISAKQLQLLLQHSYTVQQPLNSDEFKKFDFKKWLLDLKAKEASMIINGNFIKNNTLNNIHSSQIKPNNRQINNKKQPSKSTLAGSLLGVQVEDSDDDNDNDITNSKSNHLLNLEQIFQTTTNPNDLNQSRDNIEIDVDKSIQDNNNINNNTTKSNSPFRFVSSSIPIDELLPLSTNTTTTTTNNNNNNPNTYENIINNNNNDSLQDETLLPMKYGRMLDVGAGSGRMAQLLTDIFDEIECTEVSEQMVKLIRSKGFQAHYIDNLDNMPNNRKFDVICLFNLIDRCDEPISLLYQLHQRLRPQLQQHRQSLMLNNNTANNKNTTTNNNTTNTNNNNTTTNINNNESSTISNFTETSAKFDSSTTTTTTTPTTTPYTTNTKSTQYINTNGRVVIAVPLPLKPSVEMTLDNHSSTTSWRTPKENIAPKQCWCCLSFEESLQHLVMNIIDPCGYDVLSISRLPYLSEGNLYHTHFTLEDVIIVCAPKPEWTP